MSAWRSASLFSAASSAAFLWPRATTSSWHGSGNMGSGGVTVTPPPMVNQFWEKTSLMSNGAKADPPADGLLPVTRNAAPTRESPPIPNQSLIHPTAFRLPPPRHARHSQGRQRLLQGRFGG